MGFALKNVKYILIAMLMITSCSELYAQFYELTLNQRRRFDQIHVEVWARSLTANAPEIGYASLVIQYDAAFLSPAAEQSLFNTDTINFNLDVANPVDSIASPFHSKNGYNSLNSRSYGNGYYSLELTLSELGTGGVVAGSKGKGSFLGKVIFNIIDDPAETDLTGIEWSKNALPGNIQLFDADSSSIRNNTIWTDPGNFTVTGVTILSPNLFGQVIDRDENYAALTGAYLNSGYPLYFERSVNPTDYSGPVNENLSYHFEYSIDDGQNWSNIGRVRETDRFGSVINNDPAFLTGSIFNPNVANAFTITTQKGQRINQNTYRSPLRIIWKKNPFFTFRSEQARVRATQLIGSGQLDVLQKTNMSDISDARAILGRLFFVQLNGTNEYLKTEEPFSNATQLTVESWINLNSYQPTGSEVGIVVSSGGSQASPYLGSLEGAWMLYLKDGKYPAFRAREINARGTNGYLGTVVAYEHDMLSVASDASPLAAIHAENWVHIAATVKDNIIKLYVNGEMVDSYTNTNATDIRMMTSEHPIWIGVNPNTRIEADDYLHAGVKGVKVWRVALSQDQIRTNAAGVVDPTNVSGTGDIKKGLQLYYTFEGNSRDAASETQFQFGNEALLNYINGALSSNVLRYRPDMPHIKVTSPSKGVGVLNKANDIFPVRWISYGIGDIAASNTNDVAIEYSLDNGITWNTAKNPDGDGLGNDVAVDVELCKVNWEAFENNDPQANLRTISPYSKKALLRVRGTDEYTQSSLNDTEGEFFVAPYFSLQKGSGSILVVDGKKGMNLSTNDALIEAWIRPYRFPDEEERFFPIIEKADSASNGTHYALRLKNDGTLEFRVSDASGVVRVANSDPAKALVRPNSIDLDSAWTHVAVQMSKNGTSLSDVIFYVDGTPQTSDSIRSSLGANLVVNSSNNYPTYIGYKPTLVKSVPDTIELEAQQTQTIFLSGNINSGTPEGATREAQIPVFDGAGNEYDFTAIFTKSGNDNEYRFTASIDGAEIPTQTENIKIEGNLNAADTVDTEFTIQTVIRDYTGTDHNLDLLFRKTAANIYRLEALINDEPVSQNTIEYLPGGTILSPTNVIISAADLNTIVGDDAFDENTPKDIKISLINSTNAAGATSISADPYDYFVRFDPDGTIGSPFTVRLNALDINNALGNQSFDEVSPKNVTVVLAEVGNESEGVTQTADNDSFIIEDQDGRTASTTFEFTETPRGFIGEIREVRFWNGLPNNVSKVGTEPTELTRWIQGSANVYSGNLTPSFNANLYSAFSFNGGSFVRNGTSRSAASSNNGSILIRHFGDPVEYVPSIPYIKLIEPVFKQQVANTDENLKVRWIGFNYNGATFKQGASNNPPSLEFSIRGGGGNVIQPYQYLGGRYWAGNPTNSITYPDSTLFKFKGTGSDLIFAARVNAGIADPDENNDGTFNDQGPLSASLTNARLRLTYDYTINSETKARKTESPLFTVTPASNFTVRVLLEGYHNGDVNNRVMRNLGSSYDEGGIKISLYEDNSGAIGDLVGQSESLQGYDDRNPLNRDGGNNRFGNVNFIFTDLNDGNYWVVVDHPNHLPVMSRFAAKFEYEGDDRTTWAIESGWDFQTWNGVNNNVLQAADGNIYDNESYTAYGDAISDVTNPDYSTTGLIFNDGAQSTALDAVSAMVGGDVDRSLQIDAADRVQVRLDDGTGLVRSDITGDKVVNADDRTIVDRNFGKVSSLFDVLFPPDPNNEIIKPRERISDLNTELSRFFVDNAKIERKSINKFNDKNDELQAEGIRYEVTAVPELDGNFVNVSFYIRNLASKFGLANCTFAIKYDPTVLGFTGLYGADSVLFSELPDKGYAPLRTAPRDESDLRLKDVRTIEVDYDAFADLGGEAVPYEKTFLGTLRFGIKDKNSKIKFEWHYATSVHTTEGYIVTEDGMFGIIPSIRLYDIDLVYPDGGESFSPGNEIPIKWLTNAGDLETDIEFSSNAGNTWYPVNEDQVLMSDAEYIWQVPNENSTRCLIRMIDASDNAELDRSVDYFSILPNFAQIIRPSSADPVYAGGSMGEITWITQGYQSIYFEYSSDGGNSWKKVTQATDAELKSTNWKIPQETTKQAVIRMMNVSTDTEIARSGIFKVLSGTFVFKTPKGGERLYVDNQARIRWAANNVAEFDLDISTDGGFSWDKLEAGLDARQQSYLNWLVPNTPTQNALIRATWQGDPNMEYNRTGSFEIFLRTSVVENEKLKVDIFPNPASDFIRISGNNIELIEIVDINGIILKSIEQNTPVSGMKIDCSAMPIGTYLLKISAEGQRLTEEIKIIR